MMALPSGLKILLYLRNTRRLSTAVISAKLSNHIEAQDITKSAPGDISNIATPLPKTFNFAAYVNQSSTLQNLIQLNVNLNKIEKKPYLIEKLLKLDFDRDISKYIYFLKDYIHPDSIGDYITKNPLIFYEPLEDLEVRVNYLQSKNFSAPQIERIICKNPFWLMFSTVRIDKRLGFFQGNYHLNGKEVRHLAARQPKLITYSLQHVNVNNFVLKEEMGFQKEEIKKIILNKPKLFMLNQKTLLERFNLLHNVIKIPHTTILEFPEVLLCRSFKVKQRHLFLEKLGRAQYDCMKENYVPIKALVEGTDVDFCKEYAKCNVNDFNYFLKTL